MARDRKALLAEQQANLEQLITLISAGINRDLPLRVEQIVRAEVGRALVTLVLCRLAERTAAQSGADWNAP